MGINLVEFSECYKYKHTFDIIIISLLEKGKWEMGRHPEKVVIREFYVNIISC